MIKEKNMQNLSVGFELILGLKIYYKKISLIGLGVDDSFTQVVALITGLQS